ncbi:MAG: peroxiredoxin [Acidobacteria bacterium]|nr:MAG: peroxiredoxin [Acidobacteriota bacterium]
MAEHKATIKWTLSQGEFLNGTYSREHTWRFDGGMTVAASSSPAAVRVPFSNPANVDPEEAFVASLSSCHMLTYLFIASRKGFEVTSYEDEAVGVMTNNEKGTPWVSAVTLHPRITYSGSKTPTAVEESQMHHAAHEGCFIANSVKTEVKVATALRKGE